MQGCYNFDIRRVEFQNPHAVPLRLLSLVPANTRGIFTCLFSLHLENESCIASHVCFDK